MLHIVAGTVGLVIGLIAMYSPKRKGLHTKIGVVYFYVMALVCATAMVMAVMHWAEIWWFFLVAVFSFSFAFKGYLAAKLRGPGWLRKHISGMLASYLAMTTALLVVNSGKIPGSQSVSALVFWIFPTMIGVPLIRKTAKKFA